MLLRVVDLVVYVCVLRFAVRFDVIVLCSCIRCVLLCMVLLFVVVG